MQVEFTSAQTSTGGAAIPTSTVQALGGQPREMGCSSLGNMPETAQGSVRLAYGPSDHIVSWLSARLC